MHLPLHGRSAVDCCAGLRYYGWRLPKFRTLRIFRQNSPPPRGDLPTNLSRQRQYLGHTLNHFDMGVHGGGNGIFASIFAGWTWSEGYFTAHVRGDSVHVGCVLPRAHETPVDFFLPQSPYAAFEKQHFKAGIGHDLNFTHWRR